MSTTLSRSATAPPVVADGAGGASWLGVPWRTVVPIAVVVAYADGFWVVAMRGAVGSIERVDAPFRTWLWESTLLLPVYVLAVVAALTLALRRFGPDLRRARGATAATLGAVVLAGTLAGFAALAASTAYDYRLEMAELTVQHASGHGCGVDCLAVREQATLALQLRAVGLGSLLMLVSDVVLVGLVVAFRGGRIDVAARRRRTPLHRGRADDATAAVRGFLVAGLVGAGLIHTAVVPEHLAEWPAAGAFFVVLAVAEVTVAVLLFTRFERGALRAAALLSAGTVLVWLDSRTDGLSFGPGAGVAEPVGVADLAATLLEVATLVAAVAALVLRDRRSTAPLRAHDRTIAVLAMAALTFIGLGGALGVFGGLGHAGAPEDHPEPVAHVTTHPAL